ncbi:ras guanine nucleotide exchange factor domain-containing protein [Crucibulum laeve]|uniref:Ras guanine nucleotide exchange factor domain-containing protein n=1 Tax=Crucibulum laeve TaxID=68775 RepID=A0A5C3MA83_9AGAR|nr:ras guanine nucleotide exchange factor domain-containing protein [Crucibulum laeve]
MYYADSQSTPRATSSATPSQQVRDQLLPQQPDPEQLDDQYTTLFCRALYDYDAQDASALSFRRGDIIEVLTQQPSGWWDGLLGDERGWFPSNYVTIITDEEAEAAFAGSDFGTQNGRPTETHPDPSVVDMSHAMMGSTQAENEEWLDNELSYRNGSAAHGRTTPGNPSQPSSDFWMPEVTADGQIYYVNTHTGQRSRDLPQEAEEDVSDTDLAGLTSQSSSRSGTAAGLAFGMNDASDTSDSNPDVAGFGIVRSTGTPEPWIRKLADDGMSYYYYNKKDGRVQWTRPEANGRSAPARNRADPLSSSTTRQPTDTSRLSVYSDDSDVAPLDHLRPRPQQPNGQPRRLAELPTRREPNQNAMIELTSAERIAKSLQQALAPAPAEFITDLSAMTRGAIQAVTENVHASGERRQPEEDQRMDELIYGVVQAVRNLLYISAPPTSQIPNTILPKDARDPKTHSASPLKPAQRKVTATLSRLVLSARAMQYDSGSQLSDTLSRIVADAEELERAILSFVLEVQRTQHATPSVGLGDKSSKRLQGVFSTVNIGLGLVGAGIAASWRGFGWLSLDDADSAPKRVLSVESIADVASHILRLEDNLASLSQALRVTDDISGNQVLLLSKNAITQVSSFLNLVEDIHVARHVDIDGVGHSGSSADNDRYFQTVEKARKLVRKLEAVVQAVYEDGASLLLVTQKIRDADASSPADRRLTYNRLDSLSSSLKANSSAVKQTLDALLSLGHEQADVAQGDYNGSIEWRMSRLSAINDQFGGAVRESSKPMDVYDFDNEDVVDMELAFNRPGLKPPRAPADSSYDSFATFSNSTDKGTNGRDTFTSLDSKDSLDMTLVSSSSSKADPQDNFEPDSEAFDDDIAKSPPRPAGPNKLQRLLGEEYANKVAADLQPWYLQPSYSPSDILIDPDNSVRGGTVPALIERLTAHEQVDPTFTKAFLMTYKSFTTLDELFNLLVERFKIQPPATLTPFELEEWGKLKQHVIQMRVLNTLKSMVVDEDVLEKEDMYILDRMKEFISSDEVSRFAAAKQLLILIERAQRKGENVKTMVNTNQAAPPMPILPKTSKKLKLSDIDPLELARQLTLMESQLYQKIKPMECLQRSRESKTENIDNITVVIQTSNQIANWVAESVLSKEDSRKRAQAVKYLINVADRCRALHNFSTMIAITSGLNTPPIRRLKRTWEQVNQRFLAQFTACEMTIDSNKNFTKYRQLMASVTPPCVPFIGVFLSTLQFIQDGNPDNLEGGLVNFRKRQKAAEVISDIKRWQAQPFNLTIIPSIQSYIEESLNQYSKTDTRASSDHFWALSLEREPREREDEKMARLLQESGFL